MRRRTNSCRCVSPNKVRIWRIATQTGYSAISEKGPKERYFSVRSQLTAMVTVLWNVPPSVRRPCSVG